MRKFFPFASILIFLISWSCEKTLVDPKMPKEEDKYYYISLNLNGDIQVSYEPMKTRADILPTDDIYGINVYYDKYKDSRWELYSYGIFDNVPSMNIQLLSGHKYKFECTLVKNGKNLLYYGKPSTGSASDAQDGFGLPFAFDVNTKLGAVENKFIASTNNESLKYIKDGLTHLKNARSAIHYAQVDRYYGELSDYIPMEGGSAVINLKRTVFGAKFIIEGVKDGSLIVSCGGFWNKTTSSDLIEEQTYCTPWVYSFWKEEPLTELLNVSFRGNDGFNWSMQKSKQIVFKRNTMTTIKIVIFSNVLSPQISFTEEPLSIDNYIDLEINDNGLIDTPVQPNN